MLCEKNTSLTYQPPSDLIVLPSLEAFQLMECVLLLMRKQVYREVSKSSTFIQENPCFQENLRAWI